MYKDLNEKDMAAANVAMKPMIKELVDAWGEVGNTIMEAHRKELEALFPKYSHKIARMTIMYALPSFISNCCVSISPSTQMQLTATLVCDLLSCALTIDKGVAQAEHELIQSLTSALGGTSDDDTSDDDDRDPAEH